MGGIADSLLLVSLCGLCTFLTGLSLSAIATNGAMKVHILYNYISFTISFQLTCDSDIIVILMPQGNNLILSRIRVVTLIEILSLYNYVAVFSGFLINYC